MVTHRLKTELGFWNAVNHHEKTFEVRKNDRDFKVGDYLLLDAVECGRCRSQNGASTNEITVGPITYILKHEDFPQGIQPGYCVMGWQE